MEKVLYNIQGIFIIEGTKGDVKCAFNGFFEYDPVEKGLTGKLYDHFGFSSIRGKMTESQLEFAKKHPDRSNEIYYKFGRFKDAWTGNWEDFKGKGQANCFTTPCDNPISRQLYEQIFKVRRKTL